MRVAIVGAGSVGRVFGVRLACAGADVDFVVRRPHGGPLRIEEVGGPAATLASPSYVTTVPAHADAVMVCVRGDQLDDALDPHWPDVPTIVFAPMLPATHARARTRLGDRLLPAMSSVTGYTNLEGVVRYWLSRSTKTLVEEPPCPDAAVIELVRELARAGIDAHLERGTAETSAATALLFLPLALGLDAAGSIDALMSDSALLELTFRAAAETRLLAERCGKVARWAGLVTRFLGPHTIRMGLSLGRRRAPEAVAFVEEHFGRKVHAQNVQMAAEALALAAEKGTPCAALTQLLARVGHTPA